MFIYMTSMSHSISEGTQGRNWERKPWMLGLAHCRVMSQLSYTAQAYLSREWCCHNGRRSHTSIISQDNHLKTTPPSWPDPGNSSTEALSFQETVGCIKLMIKKNQPAEQDSHLILKQSLSLLVPFSLWIKDLPLGEDGRCFSMSP